EYGILVWHDFMFACIDYPGDDEEFMSEVRTEADYQTRRLANHPSLALWAGGNEVQAMHQAVWNNLNPGPWGSEIFNEVLPEAIRRNSPTVNYWANSPATDVDTDPRVNGTRPAIVTLGKCGMARTWEQGRTRIIPALPKPCTITAIATTPGGLLASLASTPALTYPPSAGG
ncbi:hypothetical protein, partial [Klebsiella pneumoniae]|uniref:hypothetical protein n=1 Tax=Klebsiella pneumoniae TaxID=573 RepID=UPI001EED7B01